MYNTIRIHFDANSVVVFSDADNKNYLADAKTKLAELGGRMTKIEKEIWSSRTVMRSCDVVSSI